MPWPQNYNIIILMRVRNSNIQDKNETISIKAKIEQIIKTGAGFIEFCYC